MILTKFARRSSVLRHGGGLASARAVALFCATLALPFVQAQVARPKPPATRTDNVKETLYGMELTDPYRWLEDQNSPETRTWIDAQNAHTQSLIGHLPGREAIEKRLGELLKVDTVGMPSERGGRPVSKIIEDTSDEMSFLFWQLGVAQ